MLQKRRCICGHEFLISRFLLRDCKGELVYPCPSCGLSADHEEVQKVPETQPL